jgi:hypothetical protein
MEMRGTNYWPRARMQMIPGGANLGVNILHAGARHAPVASSLDCCQGEIYNRPGSTTPECWKITYKGNG